MKATKRVCRSYNFSGISFRSISFLAKGYYSQYNRPIHATVHSRQVSLDLYVRYVDRGPQTSFAD